MFGIKLRIFGSVAFVALLFGLTIFLAPKPSKVPLRQVEASSAASSAIGTANSGKTANTSGPLNALVQVQKQIKIFDEISASRNDNDPRLDRELKVLSAEARQAFREKYRAIPKENRNALGAIVFLLARNIETDGDLGFFEDVLREKPCLSMVDCSREILRGDRDEHALNGMDVSLNYPQLVALHGIENFLKSKNNSDPLSPVMRNSIIRVLEAGREFPAAAVSRKASELQNLMKG